MIAKLKKTLYLALLAAVVISSYFAYTLLIVKPALSDSDFSQARQEIESRPLSDELKTDFPELRKMDNLQRDDLKKAIDDIISKEGIDQSTFAVLLELIDKALISAYPDLNKYALKVLFRLYAYQRKYDEIKIGSDESRKMVVIGYLHSQDEVIRQKAFSVLAMYFVDEDYVVPSLLDAASDTGSHDKFEKLHYIRTLGATLDGDRPLVKEFLISEVQKFKSSSDANAVFVESAYFLSGLDNPPEVIIPSIIEMLEGDYFGSPMLLDAIENYGVKVTPYLDRLKALQERVNERILHSRDNQGRGSSTFSRQRFQEVVAELESLNNQ